MLAEPEDGAGGIIAFDRKFHVRIAAAGCPAKSAAPIDAQAIPGYKEIHHSRFSKGINLKKPIGMARRNTAQQNRNQTEDRG
jgi:hypothetical protein